MGHHHDGHQALVHFTLYQCINADIVITEDASHVGQHAGLVLHVQAQVEAAGHVIDGQNRLIGHLVGVEAQIRYTLVVVHGQCATQFNDVSHDSGSRRLGTSAGAVEQGRPHRIAIDHDGVHHAIHGRQHGFLGNQGRVHTQLDAVTGVLGNPQVFDAVTEMRGAGHVFGGNPADPLGVDLGKLQRNTERNGGQNGQLVGCINTFYVEGGVRFRVTQRLRFCQHVIKGPATLFHFGEDEVAGAIDNARQPVHMVRGQAFTQ